MGSKNCMNKFCRATTSSEWKKGWSLRSGGFATLCYSCGSAYEKSAFCENFHAEESGWRDCRLCGKLIHCGCIASRYLHEYMDFGGVGCISCVKHLEMKSMPLGQIPGDIPNGPFLTKNIRDVNPTVLENRINDDKFSTDRFLQLTRAIGINDIALALEQVKRKEPVLKIGESSNDKFSTDRFLQLTRGIGVNDIASALEQVKRKEPMLKTGESSKNYSNLVQPSSSAFGKAGNLKPKQVIKDTHESTPQPSLNFSLTSSLGSSSPVLPFPSGVVEVSDQCKGSYQQGPRARHILPKPSKPNLSTAMETNKEAISQTRVARPPTDGRGRNQLLPRYWPRITDQELQQLSGDLKSTIVPLFEKILSASDAGRIGRLVLPKACAEAYFPSINQSEGIPIRIQDIKGKEWTFQFRFWPNNNSRMYVLEGVTPCIQNMQLQAGDTVIFSRIDPGSQLVIGGRKASNNVDVQDAQTPSVQNNGSPGETSFSGVNDNVFSNGFRMSDDSQQRAMSEKKKVRNIKNKRLLMHSDDAMELRITWEEAQDLFRPSPSSEPTVCMVEDHEFEEFEEPPVFGKRTIFTSRLSGEQEQLAQCDSCLKWRRLPLHALLSTRWTCSENIWDPKRSSCSAPEDINPRNLESFFSINKDPEKRKTPDNKLLKEGEPSGLDALATAAVLGDNIVEMAGSSVGATTRHPRHRRGCTCIVCIQPPSGKGRHESSCQCNVCLTVKRRFKTLMMRKKKRQSDREAELALEKEKIPMETGLECEYSNENENEMDHKEKKLKLETNEGLLDLNCDPHREDAILAEAAGMSLTTLMNAASLPSDMYLGQNGSPGLGPTPVVSRVAGGDEENVVDEGGLDSKDVEQENAGNDGEQ